MTFAKLIVAVCTIFLTFSGLSHADQVTVLIPSPNAVIHSRVPFCHLVLKFSTRTAPKLLCVQDCGHDQNVEPLGTWQKKGEFFVHYRLALKPGLNVFEVDPGGKEIKLTYHPVYSQVNANPNDHSTYIFHRKTVIPRQCMGCHGKQGPPNSEVISRVCNLFSPTCYSCHKAMVDESSWKHGPAANWLCRCCHQTSLDANHIIIPVGKVDVICYRCHVNRRKWKGKAHVHGPVGTGDCTVCHNPHGSRYPFQLWADGEGTLCVNCHTDKKRWLVKCGRTQCVHGIIKGNGCLACHSPHASENRYQLRKPINDLCGGCHIHFKDLRRGHPVQGHPVQASKDPRRNGRRFSCTSCHNPHGSGHDHMLIGDSLSGYVCYKCHR